MSAPRILQMNTADNQQSTGTVLEQNHDQIGALRSAYRRGNLTLYLGAGVSAANGFPNWPQLVLAMYIKAVSEVWKQKWQPYPNYLYAIAEWCLDRGKEPEEITAQKTRLNYGNGGEFLEVLRQTLYAGFGVSFWDGPGVGQIMTGANPTLKALAELCRQSTRQAKGIQSVVTYNYDNLLELATEGSPCRFVPVWKSSPPLGDGDRPIYHVHGYLPPIGVGSKPEDLVFTEDEYHAASNDPYSWSNLCQLKCLSSSVGLMVGLSLKDRNLRRLLTALKKTSPRKDNYALLTKPKGVQPKLPELEEIHKKALEYRDRMAGSGAKPNPTRENQMLDIFQELDRHELDNQAKMLRDLGITPIWYDPHDQVPDILNAILPT